MSKQLELDLNENNELDVTQEVSSVIIDKVKKGINKETSTVDFVYKKEKKEDGKKPSLDYVDINSKVGLHDEDGNLDVSSDLESLERFTEYTKKLLPKFDSRYQQLKEYINRGLYKPSIRSDFSLSDEQYEQFISNLFEIYEQNDRGDTTFVSSSLYYNSYALRVGRQKLLSKYGFKEEWLPEEDYLDGNTILEDKPLTAVRISLFTAKGDVDTAKNLVKNFALRTFHPATPTYSNAGISKSGEPTSCYIFVAEDDIDSIQYLVSVALQKSKRGGGIGYDLSNIRAVGESIKDVEGRAKGIIPVAKGIEWAVNYADQDGKRPGSAVVYLNVFHPDIEVFLDSKKENADSSIRLSTLSTGICVPDKFMELYEKGEDYYTFYPRSLYDEYGLAFNEINMTEMYDELVANPRIKKKKVNIKDLVTTIARIHGMRGYPYIFFTDNVNKQHAFKSKKIICSNLCSEILQTQVPGTYDVQCTLSAINVYEVIKNNSLEDTMYYTMKMLNNILDIPHEDETDVTVVRAKQAFRAVGIGVLNFHGFLANHNIAYESREARDFSRVFFAMFNYYSLKASNREVERYGKFSDFEDTTYADGTYFDKYIAKDYVPVTDKVKEIFEDYGIVIPNKEDWEQLKQNVMAKGLANAYRNCLQPTGSISYLSGATQSVMPITKKVETRAYKQYSAKVTVPNLNNKNFFYYKEATYMDVFRYLDLMAVIQEHIDQGISTTIFMTDEITSDKWGEIIMYAHKRGLKTLYYSKTKTVKNKTGYNQYEECISCT